MVPVEDRGDDVMDMESNSEIWNNELIDGVAWISGMSEASVSIFDSVHLNNTSTDDDSSDSTDNSEIDSSSEYCPTPLKKARVSPVDLGNSVFLCQTAQLQQFIDQINETSVYYTSMCSGKLVPVHVKFLGLGGCAEVKFSCSDCGERMINLVSSVELAFSQRMACSLAMQVALIASGCMHAQYDRILKQGLGISAVSASSFYDAFKLLHPIVGAMVSEMCEVAKNEMKALNPTTVGSWKQVITSSDGTWLTRGKFSQNCTFIIRNYMNNSLLYFVHLCMRGKGVSQDQLYCGTAKGAEGHAADIAFKQAKDKGMMIEVQWQDADSSSSKGFIIYYPDKDKSKVMLCGGHVARAHIKLLGEVAKQKSFSETKKDSLKKEFADVTKVQCHCPKRHRKNCGCISKSFLRGVRTNFFYCLLQAETSPEVFACLL